MDNSNQAVAATKRERRELARAARRRAERQAALRTARSRRLRVIGGITALAAVAVVAAVLTSSGRAPDRGASAPGGAVLGAAEVQAMFSGVPQSGTLLGDPAAGAELVQAEDPQCPACAGYSATEFPEVVQDSVRTGRVSVRLQLWPFLGPDSVRGARFVAAAALQDRAFDVLELIYRNQGQENTGYMTDDFLRRIGRAVPGFDIDRALAAMQDPSVLRSVRASTAYAEDHGATGTPTFWTRVGDGRLRRHETGDIQAARSALVAG